VKKDAVRLTPDGHPDKPLRLNNLGNSLFHRFEHLGDLSDLNMSVSVAEDAVRLTPDDHPDKPSLLDNLGNSLLCRFEHLGDLSDLNTSASVFEDAVRLTPDGHPDKPSLLNNLGSSLFHHFERLGDLSDLNTSVSVKEDAVRLTSDGHPETNVLVITRSGPHESRKAQKLHGRTVPDFRSQLFDAKDEPHGSSAVTIDTSKSIQQELTNSEVARMSKAEASKSDIRKTQEILIYLS
jgi:hypothetical protein